MSFMQENRYLVLFFTQYGAISYSRLLKQEGMENQTRPVPRSLSSSCGICVQLETDRQILDFITEDVEAIYRVNASQEYEKIYENQDEF